jgi:hypothetical protein
MRRPYPKNSGGDAPRRQKAHVHGVVFVVVGRVFVNCLCGGETQTP